MNTLSTTIRCPGCGGTLVPRVLCCAGCELKIEGNFSLNEFAGLSADDLHFLRIFVHCEGRIRDMESALGVSYPTIKLRLGKLKEALASGAPPATAGMPAEDAGGDDATAAILRELEAGRLSFDEAMRQIREKR